MCQVCANNGNNAEEVKVEGISGRIFVTSFSRYVVNHTSHKHVHVQVGRYMHTQSLVKHYHRIRFTCSEGLNIHFIIFPTRESD